MGLRAGVGPQGLGLVGGGLSLGAVVVGLAGLLTVLAVLLWWHAAL